MNTESERASPRLWDTARLQGTAVEDAIDKYRMQAAPRYQHLTMQVVLAIAVIAFLASSVALLIKHGL